MAVVKTMFQKAKKESPILEMLRENDYKRAVKQIARYNEKFKKINTEKTSING